MLDVFVGYGYETGETTWRVYLRREGGSRVLDTGLPIPVVPSLRIDPNGNLEMEQDRGARTFRCNVKPPGVTSIRMEPCDPSPGASALSRFIGIR